MPAELLPLNGHKFRDAHRRGEAIAISSPTICPELSQGYCSQDHLHLDVYSWYRHRSHPQRDQQPRRNHQIHTQEHQANRTFFVDFEPHEDTRPSQREET
jgi:hypothetical protein